MASLVLGLAALPALLLCGVGVLLALAGLVLGVIAVLRGTGRGMALWGIAASVITLIIATVAIVWLANLTAECADPARYPNDTARRDCVRDKVPFAKPATPH